MVRRVGRLRVQRAGRPIDGAVWPGLLKVGGEGKGKGDGEGVTLRDDYVQSAYALSRMHARILIALLFHGRDSLFRRADVPVCVWIYIGDQIHSSVQPVKLPFVISTHPASHHPSRPLLDSPPPQTSSLPTVGAEDELVSRSVKDGWGCWGLGRRGRFGRGNLRSPKLGVSLQRTETRH